MGKLVECVPNFSEGRDEAVVRDLVEVVASAAGVFLLDRTMDADHHRSVLTFAGPPDEVAEAAFRAVRLASQRIDLRLHHGGHPRVGATDVVPFVPLEGVTMEDCVSLARNLGDRIANELNIPVFFYEEAAFSPGRRRLESIRRGGLEGLGVRMAWKPLWKPDRGPARPHPTAGVTVVGARRVLVAFNVNLASRDLALADTIAKSIRESSGGLPCVKAIGLDLATRGQVQVSMNLTDIDVTPLHVAFEAVRKMADRAGVAIAGSELIGLVPQRAVLAAAQAGLRLEACGPDQILEMKVARARVEHQGLAGGTLAEFFATLGSTRPTPAAASLAAIVGAMSVQLGAKVAGIRAKKAGETPGESDRIDRFNRISRELCRLAEMDAVAYSAVLESRRLDASDPRRVTAISKTLEEATDIPMRMAERLVDVIGEFEPAVGTALEADSVVAGTLACAAVRSLLLIVHNNMKNITNQSLKVSLQDRSRKIESCLEGLRGLC